MLGKIVKIQIFSLNPGVFRQNEVSFNQDIGVAKAPGSINCRYERP